MPSHTDADRPAYRPHGQGVLDELITQARRLREGIDAVRPGTDGDAETTRDDGQTTRDMARRWQRALCDLAARQAEELGGHLGQLRAAGQAAADGSAPEPVTDARTEAEAGAGQDGGSGAGSRTAAEGAPDPETDADAGGAADADAGGDAAAYGTAPPASLTSRVGSAEWDLLTDEVSWTQELYAIFGRAPEDGPLSLDELPSWVLPEDQPPLAAAVTDCLVDGRPIDHEFRIMRPDGAVRSLHLLGEPLLDEQGGTACMWAAVRDVSELRRSELALREARETMRGERAGRQDDRRRGALPVTGGAGTHGTGGEDAADGDATARAESRLAAALRESMLPGRHGHRLLPQPGDGRSGSPGSEAAALDVASRYLPSEAGRLTGGDWHDTLQLPGGATLVSAGELTGHGVAAASGTAMLLGAVRGMAFAGVAPGAVLTHLNELLEASAQPALGSAVFCRYEPRERRLTWSQAGHRTPVVFRGGTGRVLDPPHGVLLGAASGTVYGERTEVLGAGDVFVLHSDGLEPDGEQAEPGGPAPGTPERLLRLGPRFVRARSAQECLRVVVEEFGAGRRENDACVLVARVSG